MLAMGRVMVSDYVRRLLGYLTLSTSSGVKILLNHELDYMLREAAVGAIE